MRDLVFVGTYSVRGSRGVYPFRMRDASGALEPLEPSEAGSNPSFLAVAPGGSKLYAVNEIASWAGGEGGLLRAFGVDRKTGGLSAIDSRPSGGSGPCHVSLDAGASTALVANFGGGSVLSVPLAAEGGFGEGGTLVEHPRGEREPRAHAAVSDPAGRFVLVPDLGLDRIMIYRLERGALEASDPPWVELETGEGPRHVAFHPLGRHACVINELGSTVCLYAWAAGRLELLDRRPTLPPGYGGRNACADVRFSPDGRYLYGSNRGHDSIAILSVDLEGGALRPAGHVSTRGSTPRSFAVGERWLLAANQESDTLVRFRRDPGGGGLEFSGETHGVPAPVCVLGPV